MALRTRRERRRRPGKFKLHKAPWVDPFPHIPGTEPEKRIFAALVERRIYFRYQADAPIEVGQLTVAKVSYIPDFVLPEYRVVIDPFSPFHHSLPGAVKRDSRKIGLFTAAGWEYYHPWAMPNGRFSLDQFQHTLGRRTKAPLLFPYKFKGKTYKGKLKGGRNRFGERRAGHFDARGNFIADERLAPGGDLTNMTLSASELLYALPLVAAGPRYPLLDPEDVKAKRDRGYFLGTHLGAGATSVAAANRARKVYPALRLRRRR